MAETKILHIQGNQITIGFPVEEVYADLRDGSLDTNSESLLIDSANTWVVLRRGLLVRQYRATVSFNYVHFTDKGHLPCGEYDIEVYYDSTDEGHHMRLKYEKMLTVVDSTEQGQVYQSTDFDVLAYYPVINGREAAVIIGDGYVRLMAGAGLRADIDSDSVNLRAGYGNSTVEVTENNVNININE